MTFKTTNGYDVQIDAADYPYVMQLKWYRISTGYIRSQIKGKSEFLHRFILNAKTGDIVDHADRNPANNTRGNLRIANTTQNRANAKKRQSKTGKSSSIYKGVTRKKGRSGRPWQAQIGIGGGKVKFLGTNGIHFSRFFCRRNALRSTFLGLVMSG